MLMTTPMRPEPSSAPTMTVMTVVPTLRPCPKGPSQFGGDESAITVVSRRMLVVALQAVWYAVDGIYVSLAIRR